MEKREKYWKFKANEMKKLKNVTEHNDDDLLQMFVELDKGKGPNKEEVMFPGKICFGKCREMWFPKLMEKLQLGGIQSKNCFKSTTVYSTCNLSNLTNVRRNYRRV